MIRSIQKLIVLLGLLVPLLSSGQERSTVTIKIDELRSASGDVIVSVFVDQAGFKAEKPIERHVFPKADHMQGEVFLASIDLPNGAYGLALLDDEDSDGEMDYNFIRMPKEGYGFSGFVHKGMSRPVYDDFDFSLDADRVFSVKFRYF